MNFLNRFFLDKEKDIIINLFKSDEDEITYVLETPNHKTGNLITNLAKICGIETIKNEKDMKIITGTIPAFINNNNEDVYNLKLGNVEIANIYGDGKIDQKVKVPAIIKTLMSQTKEYKLSVNTSFVNSYISKKTKLRTDLHTHINAILSPDNLIALGIKRQIKYPLYFIRKIGLTLTKIQEEKVELDRKEVEKNYINGELTGKKLERKINDETYINFADLILNNLENAEENITKIRNSLSMVKDGQAVFTNLEKLYIYRYVFTKGKTVPNKIVVTSEKIEKIPENDIRNYVRQMFIDGSKGSIYENNNILQDKLLWIGREYQKQGIKHVQIAVVDITKTGEIATKFLEDVHGILPLVEKETGVEIRFLAAVRRVWLTPLEVTQAVNVLKATTKSPYVVGSDIIGEEINDIMEFEPIIKQLVEYAITEDNGFTVRVHAGENDNFKDNVQKTVKCIKSSILEGKKAPGFRIGHGLYVNDLDTEEGRALIKDMKEIGAILEFQLSSNVRLNNLNKIDSHPIRQYLNSGIKCVQGTDGCGMYGIDTMEEQIALRDLLGLTDEDFMNMKQVEDEFLIEARKNFEKKSRDFEKLLADRSITETILELEEENIKNNICDQSVFKYNNNLESEEALKEKIVKLPENKFPVIIAGGSFNSNGRETILNENGKAILRDLVGKLSAEKAYFVVGHKMQGYEKALVDIAKEMNKDFETYAIIPKKVSEEVSKTILSNNIGGVCISNEPEELGIYKSFNYEIFERRSSVVVAFDGNSPVSNLIQEAKNGKGKAKIYVNDDVQALSEKAKYLEGYVTPFRENESIIDKILLEHPEIGMHSEDVM